MNKEQAMKATKQGAIAACLVSAITFIVVSFAISSDSSGALSIWKDPINYVDALLMLCCAYGMYRHSRIVAVSAFVFYVLARIMIIAETGNPIVGLIVSVILLYFFGRAVIGSFSYHKLRKIEYPEKYRSKWGLIVAVPLMLVFSFTLLLAVFSIVGVVPSTKVLAGSEVRESETQILKEHDIISPNDEVLYFYSEGVFSVIEGGSVLTNDRVISYFSNANDGLHVYELALSDIGNVVLESAGGTLQDSVYTVYSKDEGAWLELYLSTEEKGDTAFINSLKEQSSIAEQLVATSDVP